MTRNTQNPSKKTFSFLLQHSPFSQTLCFQHNRIFPNQNGSSFGQLVRFANFWSAVYSNLWSPFISPFFRCLLPILLAGHLLPFLSVICCLLDQEALTCKTGFVNLRAYNFGFLWFAIFVWNIHSSNQMLFILKTESWFFWCLHL
jgi:hypothetical protein